MELLKKIGAAIFCIFWMCVMLGTLYLAFSTGAIVTGWLWAFLEWLS